MNLVNGKPNSSIKIFDRGFLYGDAVFETILVENKIPQNLTPVSYTHLTLPTKA